MSQIPIFIAPSGGNDTGTCSCCGRKSRCVWGVASQAGMGIAAYFVHWTVGHVSDQGINLDMIIGSWGNDTVVEDRNAVSLYCRITSSGSGFMIIDANTRPTVSSPLVGKAFDRSEVIGTSLGETAFRIADAIFAQDRRVVEILDRWQVLS